MPEEKNQAQNGANQFISAGKEIDVEAIMKSIKQRIQEKKSAGVLKQVEIDEMEDMELLPLPDFLEIPNVYTPHLYPGSDAQVAGTIPPCEDQPDMNALRETLNGSGKKTFQPFEAHREEPTFEDESGGGVKGLIKKAMKVYRKVSLPLVRFVSRPIYNELKQLIYDRHNEARIQSKDRDNELKHLAVDWHNERNPLFEQAFHHIVVLYQETNKNANAFLDLNNYKPVIQQNKEYVKLLHNLINNMVVESSKLKIESELQKTKIKVLEDKIEFLENRERAIEKKLFGEDGMPVEKKTEDQKAEDKKTATQKTKTTKATKTKKKEAPVQ